MQRKYYFLAGANTANGFVSEFNNILNKSKKGYTFVLKGGPGTGKSTLMKKVSKYFYDKGYNVEEFYCSSDPESLDAVRIVEKNICVTDGTAPHEQDASLPKVFGEIVDLGFSVDKKIIKHQAKIKKLLEKKKNCFSNAYKFLKLAGELATSENVKQDLEKIENKRTFYLDYFNEKGISSLLKKNKFKILSLNKNSEKIFNNLKNQSQNIVEIKNTLTGSVKQVAFLDKQTIFNVEKIKIDDFSKSLVSQLCRKAGEQIVMAKLFHKQVEKIYLNYINFGALNKITNDLIDKINKHKG